MTKGFVFDPTARRFSIVNGSRMVTTTDGTLVCLLPTVYAFTAQVVTFPDFSKDYWYHWDWDENYDSSQPETADHFFGETCASFITAIPQEYEASQTLMAAPAGTDFLMSRVKLSRTTAPSHAWIDGPINVLPDQNQWIPFNGSVLMEAQLGMARAMHVVVEGGNLVIVKQQSVCVEPGGYGPYGDAGPVTTGDRSGGQNRFRTTEGFPAIKIENKINSFTRGNASAVPWTLDLGRSNACSIVDPTNYTSVYSVDIECQFGRRS